MSSRGEPPQMGSEVVVVKVTGKAFSPSDTEALQGIIGALRRASTGRRLVVVAGGGPAARGFIELARRVGVSSNYWLDTIAIAASRVNALVLAAALQPEAYPAPATTLEEAVGALASWRIVVLGGLIPGQSTAAVAVEAAEAAGSRLVVNAGAIDHVYTRDPRRHPGAKPLREVRATKLLELLESRSLPGEYQLLDRHAVEIMVRSGITMALVHYKKPQEILKAINGGRPEGTIITPD